MERSDSGPGLVRTHTVSHRTAFELHFSGSAWNPLNPLWIEGIAVERGLVGKKSAIDSFGPEGGEIVETLTFDRLTEMLTLVISQFKYQSNTYSEFDSYHGTATRLCCRR